jgi:hypothetical protein
MIFAALAFVAGLYGTDGSVTIDLGGGRSCKTTQTELARGFGQGRWPNGTCAMLPDAVYRGPMMEPAAQSPHIMNADLQPSAEYRRGWCDAYAIASDAVRRNSSRLRADVGPLAKNKSAVSVTARIMLDAIDHRVVLPSLAGVHVITPEGAFTCPGSPKP